MQTEWAKQCYRGAGTHQLYTAVHWTDDAQDDDDDAEAPVVGETMLSKNTYFLTK